MSPSHDATVTTPGTPPEPPTSALSRALCASCPYSHLMMPCLALLGCFSCPAHPEMSSAWV